MDRAIVLLHREDIGQVAVVGLGPELIPVLRADELGADPKPVPALPHAALQHRADIEPAADLMHVGLCPLN